MIAILFVMAKDAGRIALVDEGTFVGMQIGNTGCTKAEAEAAWRAMVNDPTSDVDHDAWDGTLLIHVPLTPKRKKARREEPAAQQAAPPPVAAGDTEA